MEEGTTTEGQEPEGGSEGNGNGSGEEQFDEGRARALIDKLRPFEKQAKQAAKELEQTKARLKELEDAKLSDTEKMQARLSELEAAQSTWARERQELLVRSAAEAAANRAGALHPDAVYKLLDYADLTFGEDGAPTNLDKLIEGLRKAYPTLFRAAPFGSADAGARGGQTSGGSMNDLIRQASGRT